jgi:hypothetical protein
MEIPPTMCDGSSWWKGNMNPVTLVSTVVPRKSAVQNIKSRDVNMAYKTMRPLEMPIRLITT